MDLFCNLVLFACIVPVMLRSFRENGSWNVERGKTMLRFFTILSNLFCALAALLMALCRLSGNVPYGIWLLKYIGTASVTVTLMTVLVFLGPTMGYKELLSGWDFWLHLAAPLLAIVSFCFLERLYPLSFGMMLLGVLPVLLYGTVYLNRVVQCPPEKRWEDFYGFNKGGHWRLSFVLMLLGSFLLCLALRLLSGLG